VLYRSKNDTLPDFSKEDGSRTEVFFDVRSTHFLDSSLKWMKLEPVPQRQTYFLVTVLLLFQFMGSLTAENISPTAYHSLCEIFCNLYTAKFDFWNTLYPHHQGSDFSTIYIRSTDSPLASVNGKSPGHDNGRFPEEIRFVKFSSIVWTHDSKGFFYHVFFLDLLHHLRAMIMLTLDFCLSALSRPRVPWPCHRRYCWDRNAGRPERNDLLSSNWDIPM